jgi:capsular polysaccharide biosynthesis protein
LLTEELLLTTIPSANYNVSKWTIEFLRHVVPARANRLPPIFLNRRPPDKRVIVNEEEVSKMLAELGIRSIETGKMSFQDQVETFASAEFVTGIHGASFANSVYSKPGSLILDLTPRNYVMPYFERLAEACSNRYTRILGREAGTLPGQAPVPDADIIVPVKRLKAEILKELSRSSMD